MLCNSINAEKVFKWVNISEVWHSCHYVIYFPHAFEVKSVIKSNCQTLSNKSFSFTYITENIYLRIALHLLQDLLPWSNLEWTAQEPSVDDSQISPSEV